MDLDFSDEQLLLRATLRSVCERFATPSIVRAMESDPRGYPSPLWRALSDAGVLGLRIVEEQGGVGLGVLEAVIAYEEFGRSLAPSPHFESSILAARLLAMAGNATQQRAWLSRLATGNAVVIPAWLEPQRTPALRAPGTRLAPHGDRWLLSGEKTLVPFAGSADRLLVLAQHPRDPGDLVGVLVDPATQGVSRCSQPNLAHAALQSVHLDCVSVGAADCIGLDGGFRAAWSRALLEGAVVLGALAVGGAERAFELTQAYARERRQFDRPIGSFQSIAHALADNATAIEGARILVYQAAWACDAGEPFETLALMAKLQAGSMFREVSATSIQVHGGLGFTLDADPQLYYRRAKHQQLLYGDPAYLEARLATCLLDAAGRVAA
jgi:alkylation response protein AidB-like acyl-CoA dehydrogenase